MPAPPNQPMEITMTTTAIVTHDIDIESVTPPPAPARLITPSREVEKRYSDALAYLVFKWPLFAQMIYSGMEIAYTEEPGIPIAATDSHTIFINPEGFVQAGITDTLEIVFVLAHEVGHRFFNDLVVAVVWRKTGQVVCPGGVVLPYYDALMNMAMDYRINAMLVDAHLGRMPKVGLYDPAISKAGMESCAEIYQKLWQKMPKGPGGQPGNKPGTGTGKGGHGGFDVHIQPSDQQIKKDAGKREQEIVAAAQLAERTNPGSVPGALARIVGEIVHPKVAWQDHLRASMTRKAGTPKLDWRYRNRRLAGREPPQYFAKVGHKGAGTIVLGADNSGSIGNKEINVFAGEMSGIVAALNPERLIIYWCDAAITRTYVLDEPTDLVPLFAEWKSKGVGGGGGTDFNPVFEAVDKLNEPIDMLVYFTDGIGSFPAREPHYPVIWASIHKPSKYPFGEVVDVEI